VSVLSTHAPWAAELPPIIGASEGTPTDPKLLTTGDQVRGETNVHSESILS